jgi:hypothetical protein
MTTGEIIRTQHACSGKFCLEEAYTIRVASPGPVFVALASAAACNNSPANYAVRFSDDDPTTGPDQHVRLSYAQLGARKTIEIWKRDGVGRRVRSKAIHCVLNRPRSVRGGLSTQPLRTTCPPGMITGSSTS